MKNFDTESHVRGESLFINDLPQPSDLLHAAVVYSTSARGTVRRLDLEPVRIASGVVAVFDSSHIPAINQIGGIIQDEPLLCEGAIHFAGQPLAFVVAGSPSEARAAAALAIVDIEQDQPILDARIAAARGHLIAPSRTISVGNTEAEWSSCEVIVAGTTETGSQEHLYLETQGAMAIPQEKGRIKVYSSTQAPTAVQRTVSSVLGLPMNKVEVEVARLGGGFGGKEDQATPWAVMAAMGAMLTGRPVKLILSRQEDMRITGKRHPYSCDYKLGMDGDGKIRAFQLDMFQNSGAAADLSTAILERSLFHATSTYMVPNALITGRCCRTNLPPFTAFRGFGGPQALFAIESALEHAAMVLEMEPWRLKEKNLMTEGDRFPYGMIATGCRAHQAFDDAVDRYDLHERCKAAREFNLNNKMIKRGIAVTPICFGISFTNKFLNQAGALVHVYTDGTVSVNTGAVEMGQGVNTKILKIAALTLGIPIGLLTIENTSTHKVANTSPTAASSGADMNGMATEIACREIATRLLEVASDILDYPVDSLSIRDGAVHRGGCATDLSWGDLVSRAYVERVNLSAQAHYATPGLCYDKEKEHGTPFAYHVWGTSITEATVDCLRGTYEIDRVSVVHDAGKSLDETIDRGQLEGALVQGIGWVTMEEVAFGADGRLLSDTLSTYKIPDLPFIPEIESVFLDNADNPRAVMKSKAIGEPPFLYGLGSFFAVMDAVRAFRPQLSPCFHAPLTHEKVLQLLHGEATN